MLKLKEQGLFTAGSSLESPFAGIVLGHHNENNGANMQRSIMVIQVVTNPAAAETIGIGTKTYTFRVAPTLATEIAIGLSAAATAINIAAKINLDKADAGCTAYILGDTTRIALVSEIVGVDPAFTADGAKVIEDIAWATTIAEATLEDTDYYKADITVDVDAKPIVLSERYAGTWHNFLY